jgi:hypothetical protein
MGQGTIKKGKKKMKKKTHATSLTGCPNTLEHSYGAAVKYTATPASAPDDMLATATSKCKK